MHKNELFRCTNDVFQPSGRIAFAKGNRYYLKDVGPENSRIFYNEDGQEHQLSPTEFCQFFERDNG